MLLAAGDYRPHGGWAIELRTRPALIARDTVTVSDIAAAMITTNPERVRDPERRRMAQERS